MEPQLIIKAVLTLSTIFIILYLGLWVIKKYGKIGSWGGKNKANINLDNVIYIDENTKIINLTNKNGTNYVIAAGKNNFLLIDKYQTLQEKNNDH